MGSSEMEPLLLWTCETGRERLRWDKGEWGGARCVPCSLSCEWSIVCSELGAVLVRKEARMAMRDGGGGECAGPRRTSLR